jgi:dTDP-4-dehydrorhamnose 3,5-epimerase
MGEIVAVDMWVATAIPGVVRRAASSIPDQRGSFMELWRASQSGALAAPGMVQANLSRSRAGVLRGMHFHRRQADLWVVIDGRAMAATTDLRSLSSGDAARVASQVIEMVPGDALYIPPIVAHGFWALDDLVLLYLVSREYDGTDEHGFAWDDPDAAIAWPSGEPMLSDRDRSNPKLAELAARWAQHSVAR